jgi:hypothetical protein
MRLPLLQVRLSTNITAFETLGLLDSGSTSTFLPTELAEILGLQIDPATSKPAVGAGGEFRTVDFHVTIELMKGGRPYTDFRDWKVLVPVDPRAIPYMILGRDSVFRRFDITFRELVQRTILRPPKKKVKKPRFERRY